MSVYKKDRKDGTKAWYYDFSYKGERYRCVGGTTRTQALRAQEKVRLQVLNGEYDLEHQIRNPLFEDFAKKYLSRITHMRAFHRISGFVKNLVKFFSGTVLSQIDANRIEDYISMRRSEGVANSTINRELAYLRRIFNLAIKWGDARKNPMKDFEMLKEPPGRTRFLKVDEIHKLIDCSSEPLKPIIITALNTGMRVSEILTLTWEQVHIDQVIEPMIELTMTKNNKKRFIPLSNPMIHLLKNLQSKHPKYVFVSSWGEPYSGIKDPFIKARNKAKLKDFRFHDLRHTFASHFIMNGGDLLTLKELLGHSNLDMVQRYAHLASEHKRKQLDQLADNYKIPHLSATSGKSDDFKNAVNF